MMVILPPARRTRLPFELGCRPLLSSITPALVISSTNAPIRSIRSLDGGAPASLLASALSIPRMRMVNLLNRFWRAQAVALLSRRTRGVGIDTGPARFFLRAVPADPGADA